MAEFDRANPLFERNSVPVEIVVSPTQSGSDGSSSSSNFTVRILQGHRPPRNGGGGDRERVMRFEMSDECNLIDEPIDHSINLAATQGTPCRRTGMNVQHQTPKGPIIHAPFMTADRGRIGSSAMQSHGHQQGYDATSGVGGFHTKQPSAIPNRPIELYELEVGESDFSDLRRDQALLVDFNDFANSLISLLQLCELGEDGSSQDEAFRQNSFHGDYNSQQPYDSTGGWNSQTNYPAAPQWGNNSAALGTPSQQYHVPRNASPHGKMMNAAMPVSTYTCRLETNSSSSSDDSSNMQWRNVQKASNSSMHARFSIVESNQFRELTHLALNLNVGTDKSVRLYLSSRLGQTMMQTRNLQSLYAEQQKRSDAAETDLIGLNKRLQEVTHSSQAEMSQIRHQAEERLQTENCSRLAEVSEVKTAKDAEIKALNEQSERNRAALENKIRILEDINAKINKEKTMSENENERLSTKLSYEETTNSTLTNELTSLRGQLQHTSDEKASIEKSLHQLQLQLSTLEYSTNDQEKTISQTVAQRISAEKVSADAKQTLSRQQQQMEDLRRRLEEAELETSKYKDLTSRYQTNRLEMKKNIKEKVEMIRGQEDILVVRDKETTELKHRVRGLEEKVQRIQTEKDAMSRELNDARKQMDEDKVKLENNQQVIAWLNKQMNKQVNNGALWQGGRTIGGAASTASKVYPTPNTANNQTSSLSRLLPNAALAATPYQRSYVTPEVTKPTTSGVATQQLHPEPTPFLGLPRRPDASNKSLG